MFHERVSRLDLLTLFLGMAGLGIIFSGSRGAPDAAGVATDLLSGFLFSLYMINLRFLRHMKPAFLTFMNNLGCSMLLLFMVESYRLSLNQALALLLMGVVQLGLPYFLFSKGLESVPLQEAALIVLVEPVLNPLWVAFLVGERPALATVVGGGFIVGCLVARYSWPAVAAPRAAPRASR